MAGCSRSTAPYQINNLVLGEGPEGSHPPTLSPGHWARGARMLICRPAGCGSLPKASGHLEHAQRPSLGGRHFSLPSLSQPFHPLSTHDSARAPTKPPPTAPPPPSATDSSRRPLQTTRRPSSPPPSPRPRHSAIAVVLSPPLPPRMLA
ncbi:hypothetical protein VTO42DRAFT_7879 [Malbranchea cinnamomea]